MEVNDYYRNDKSSTAEEEALLLKRLIALKKQLEDDEPKLHKNVYNTKENAGINKNIISSKFKYCKVNEHVNKSLSTKIDNRDFKTDKNKNKYNVLFIKPDNSTFKVCDKSISLCSTPIEVVTSKINHEIVNYNQNTEKHNIEINEIVKNSIVKNSKSLFNDGCKTFDISQTILNIDDYMINVEDYITSSKYIVNKEDRNILSTNQMNNHAKNVHVNRKFQNKLMSTSLLNSNTKSITNSLEKVKKSSSIKKNSIKKSSEKLIESPNLVKIGNTKLIRRSLLRNKWKINNTPNSIKNNIIERKPLSPLQYSTANTLTTSYNKRNLLKISNPTSPIKSKLPNSSNTNKLKWTKPNILSVDNVNNSNKIALVPKSDKLILFGKNKIIRQSLISSIKSKTKNYLLKHLSHRFALMRKLQLKNCIPKVKNINANNEQIKNTLLLKKIENKPVEIKKNGKRSYSMYSYVNPILRSKINKCSLENTESSNSKILRLSISTNKLQQNSKIINNSENTTQSLSFTNNKTLERIKSKKVLTKQLCLVFSRFGICSKLDQGKCDKRHYKKYIALCLKFLTGECTKENCTLSHNIIEEKIPFCKSYLNNVCNKFNCPYLHEYRDKNSPICKNFLHGYCILGKKCPNKHLNLCPIFQSKNKCPHGQKCLYPHIPIDDKNTFDVEINEPRYFEITIPNIDEENEKESIHIIPKRHVPLMDLPSYIPLKK